jgi:hypothetical protein
MHDYEYEYEHDLDRTQREFEYALHELQPEYFEIPGEAESFGETDAANVPHEAGSYRASYQHPSQAAEELEFELAAELLEVTSEQELDHFLGDVFKKVGGFVSNAVKSPVFKALGGVLKPIAKAALPIAGGALGTVFGGPVGGMIGSNLGSAAGNLLGLELEGLSGEDREFEMAKRFVRLASGAAEEVKNMEYGRRHNPYSAAKRAASLAARKYLRRLRIQRARRRAALRQPPMAPWGALPQPVPWVAPPAPPVPWIAPAPPMIEPTDDTAAGAALDDSSDMPPDDAGEVAPEPGLGGRSRRGTWFRNGRRIILTGV